MVWLNKLGSYFLDVWLISHARFHFGVKNSQQWYQADAHPHPAPPVARVSARSACGGAANTSVSGARSPQGPKLPT